MKGVLISVGLLMASFTSMAQSTLGESEASNNEYYPSLSSFEISSLRNAESGDIVLDLDSKKVRVFNEAWVPTVPNALASFSEKAKMLHLKNGLDKNEPLGVAIDIQGNVYVSGSFTNSVNLGTELISSAGGADAFLAKYNKVGELEWHKTFGGVQDDISNQAFLDQDGGVIVSGYFTGEAHFEEVAKFSGNSSAIFVMKYSATGNLEWLKTSNDSSF